EALGLFARQLPICVSMAENLPFRHLVDRLRQALRDAAEWQDFFKWPDVRSDSGEKAKAAVLDFAFETEPRRSEHRAGEISFTVEHQEVYWDRFKIKLSCSPTESGWTACFHYDANGFTRQDVELLADRFQSLAESAASCPDLALADLEILGPSERQEILFDRNETRSDSLGGRCVHEAFEEQAQRSPDAVAVVFRDSNITYSELNAR